MSDIDDGETAALEMLGGMNISLAMRLHAAWTKNPDITNRQIMGRALFEIGKKIINKMLVGFRNIKMSEEYAVEILIPLITQYLKKEHQINDKEQKRGKQDNEEEDQKVTPAFFTNFIIRLRDSIMLYRKRFGISQINGMSGETRSEVERIMKSICQNPLFPREYTGELADMSAEYPRLPEVAITQLGIPEKQQAAVRLRVSGLFKKVKLMQGAPMSGTEFNMRNALQEIDWDERSDEAQKALRSAGITTTENGDIDLTGTVSNKWYVTLFPVYGGEYISGYELVKRAGAETFYDFIQGKISVKIVPPAKISDPRRKFKKDRELTIEDVYEAARHPINLEKILGMTNVRIENGKWVVNPTLIEFRQEWLTINGSSSVKGGKKILTGYGQGSLCVADMKRFFGALFGEENIKKASQESQRSTIDTYGRQAVLEEIRSEKNRENLAKCGITFEDENGHKKCHIKGTSTTIIMTGHLIIGSKEFHMRTVLKKLGIPENGDGIKNFFKEIFPDHTVLRWICKNGTSAEREETPYEEIIQALKEPDNKKKLEDLCPQRTSDGKIIVGLLSGKWLGVFLEVGGKTRGLRAIMEWLGLMTNKEDFLMLYQEVFGVEKVVLSNQKNQHAGAAIA
ncbi:MAG: hypothetical protein WC101_02815 [Candidatus Gracilibacteria bacterium]